MNYELAENRFKVTARHLFQCKSLASKRIQPWLARKHQLGGTDAKAGTRAPEVRSGRLQTG